MRRAAFLWSLVALNLGFTSGCMIAGFLGNRGGWASLIDYQLPGFMAAYGAIFIQLWMLAMFTALYDPKHRMARWLGISLVVVAAAAILCTVHWWGFRNHVYSDRSLPQPEMDSRIILGFLQRAEFGIPAIFVSLAMILLIQSICWPMRALFGWQIHFGEESPSPRRQFGTANLLAWLGFFAAFFFLVTLFRDNPVFYVVVFYCLLGTIVTFPAIAGWLFLLSRKRVSIFWIIIAAATVVLLCYLENEAALFAIQQATLAGRRAPNFWAPQIVPFNCAAALAALMNLLALRYAGGCLHSAKSRASSAQNAGASSAVIPAPSR